MEGYELRTVTKCAPDGSIISTYEQDFSWEQVRKERNQALLDSDWRAVKDRTMSQVWKDYRIALRDLPQDFPDSANDACDNFPVLPDE
ncbi:MAG TPA: hypothetical protein EYN66_24495 [Myxococcales bacterium]|nr:hypothetical protein [Myxococcales bacterium]